MDDERTVVMDLGSGETKAGFAGQEYPEYIFPTVVSKKSESKNNFIGKDALNHPDFEYPIQNGQVKNWQHVEEILSHTIDKLNINPEEDAFLISQPPKNPKKDREKLAEILFEKFNACALHEELQAMLSHYAAGRHAGLIVESGHGVTSVVPILGAYVINEAIVRLDVGGGDLDRYLSRMLNDKGYEVSPEVAKNIKEKCCYVQSEDCKNGVEDTYTLPDGQMINLENEKHQCAEALLDPSLIEQYDCQGVHEMIYTSIMRCGIDVRRDFANNIILSGGTTLFSGLEDRLRTELENRVPSRMKIGIVSQNEREIHVWRGGSILGSLSTYRNVCVSKKDYDELGVNCCKKFLDGL